MIYRQDTKIGGAAARAPTMDQIKLIRKSDGQKAKSSSSVKKESKKKVTKNDINGKKVLTNFAMNRFIASLNLELEYYAVMLNNIIDEYFVNMLDILLVNDDDNFDMNRVSQLSRSQPQPQPQPQLETKKVKKREDKFRENTYATPSQTGGGECQNITEYLDYGIADTLHDFGGDRNCVYPYPFNANNFLMEAKEFLDYKTLPKERDPLRNEYNATPGDFEKLVKINYLLGEYCPVDNIEFYFSRMIESSKFEAKVYNKYAPDNISTFYDKYTVPDNGYKYYIIDACMSIQKEEKFKTMIRLKTLCDLWDPVGGGSLEINEMFDHEDNINNLIKDIGLKLEKEEFIINNVTSVLFDSRLKKDETNLSMYDSAYDDLLNINCLEAYNITFKLRLIERDTKFYVALVTLDDGNPVDIRVLLNGGHSLPDLSIVMAYLEYDGKSFECSLKNSGPKNTDTIPELMTFVKFIYELVQKKTRNTDTTKLLLKRMVTRMKSSGDHGSARTAQFINTNCMNAIGKTMYLSGDQLCYIYSIDLGNPTLFRYFSPNAIKKSNEECDLDRVHFVGFYSPIADKNVILKVAVKRNLLFLEEYINEKIDYARKKEYDENTLNNYDKEIDIYINQNKFVEKKQFQISKILLLM